MAVQNVKPLELVPRALVPSKEVFDQTPYTSTEFSDLFPALHAEDLTGVLGDYRSGEPSNNSPFKGIIDGVRSFRTEIYRQEARNNWTRTEETWSLLGAALLQVQLISSINAGYENLLADGWNTEEAIKILKVHINSKDSATEADLKNKIDRTIRDKAAAERGEPLKGPIFEVPFLCLDDDGNIRTEILPKEDNQEFYDDLSSQYIQRYKLRLQRLKFEWLSANAVLQLLKLQTSDGSAEAA